MSTTPKSVTTQADIMTDEELSLIREEAASIADDWAERQLVEPSRKEANAKFVREILRLCEQDRTPKDMATTQEPLGWIDQYALDCLKRNASALCSPKGIRDERQTIPVYASSQAQNGAVTEQEPFGYAPSHPQGNYFTRNKSTADYVGGMMPVYANPEKQEQLVRDAARFMWLTEDHQDAETRERCRSILARMDVMSRSAACIEIDRELKGVQK